MSDRWEKFGTSDFVKAERPPQKYLQDGYVGCCAKKEKSLAEKTSPLAPLEKREAEKQKPSVKSKRADANGLLLITHENMRENAEIKKPLKKARKSRVSKDSQGKVEKNLTHENMREKPDKTDLSRTKTCVDSRTKTCVRNESEPHNGNGRKPTATEILKLWHEGLNDAEIIAQTKTSKDHLLRARATSVRTGLMTSDGKLTKLGLKNIGADYIQRTITRAKAEIEKG